MLDCLRSLWKNAELAGTHPNSPVPCWNKQYYSEMQAVDMEPLRVVDAYSCGATIALSKIMDSDAGLGVFTARRFKSVILFGPYYATRSCSDLSLRHHTKKASGDGALKVDLARIFKYEVQLRVQSRSFDGIKERLVNGMDACRISAPFCVCAYTKDYRYNKADKRCGLPQSKLLSFFLLLNATFQKKITFFRRLRSGSLLCLLANEVKNRSFIKT